MKVLQSIFLFTIIGLSWVSCKTDVDIFADPEETAVVFGLLNQTDTVQYFRVNPTFIGEGDAVDLAGDPNVTNYREGEIEVTLVDTKTDQIYKAVETDKKMLEAEGIFDPYIRMYKLPTPTDTDFYGVITNTVIKADHNYQLLIKHVQSGEKFSATTNVGNINELKMSNPSDKRNSATSFLVFHTGAQYSEYQFKFAGVNGGVKYLMELKYYYIENGETDTLSKEHFVRMKIGELTADKNQESFIIKYEGELFYSTLQQELADNPNIKLGTSFDIIFTVFGKEISTYVDVQNASLTGISQERPTYSNINNGLGVFSWASTWVYEYYYMADASAGELLNGQYTQGIFPAALFATQSGPNVKIP